MPQSQISSIILFYALCSQHIVYGKIEWNNTTNQHPDTSRTNE